MQRRCSPQLRHVCHGSHPLLSRSLEPLSHRTCISHIHTRQQLIHAQRPALTIGSSTLKNILRDARSANPPCAAFPRVPARSPPRYGRTQTCGHQPHDIHQGDAHVGGDGSQHCRQQRVPQQRSLQASRRPDCIQMCARNSTQRACHDLPSPSTGTFLESIPATAESSPQGQEKRLDPNFALPCKQGPLLLHPPLSFSRCPQPGPLPDPLLLPRTCKLHATPARRPSPGSCSPSARPDESQACDTSCHTGPLTRGLDTEQARDSPQPRERTRHLASRLPAQARTLHPRKVGGSDPRMSTRCHRAPSSGAEHRCFKPAHMVEPVAALFHIRR